MKRARSVSPVKASKPTKRRRQQSGSAVETKVEPVKDDKPKQKQRRKHVEIEYESTDIFGLPSSATRKYLNYPVSSHSPSELGESYGLNQRNEEGTNRSRGYHGLRRVDGLLYSGRGTCTRSRLFSSLLK